LKITVHHQAETFQVDLSRPLDISIPLNNRSPQVKCFYAPDVEMSPLVAGDFIGSIEKGSPVNFYNLKINPHGNGTHTECNGHISSAFRTINQSLKQFHFIAELKTVTPRSLDNGDSIIDETCLDLKGLNSEALIIRSLPNKENKLVHDYSGTNPSYLDYRLVEQLVDLGVQHLLLDLPSVDREQDEGKLLAHKAFWKNCNAERQSCTITELIYVPSQVDDGRYLLNLQICSLEMDASPSKPVLYRLEIEE